MATQITRDYSTDWHGLRGHFWAKKALTKALTRDPVAFDRIQNKQQQQQLQQQMCSLSFPRVTHVSAHGGATPREGASYPYCAAGAGRTDRGSGWGV